MNGLSIHLEDTRWKQWEDPVNGREERVRWTTVFPQTQSSPVVGIADIDPGGALPFHHHEPAEVYHVLEGSGEVEIEGTVHALEAGITAYVPGNRWHETRNTGAGQMRVLYFFPEACFEDVVYHFD